MLGNYGNNSRRNTWIAQTTIAPCGVLRLTKPAVARSLDLSPPLAVFVRGIKGDFYPLERPCVVH